MNNKMKNLMLPYIILASGMMNPEVNEFNSINSHRINVKPLWQRKKCKSCKLFPCDNLIHKCKQNPLHQACVKYEKRKQ